MKEKVRERERARRGGAEKGEWKWPCGRCFGIGTGADLQECVTGSVCEMGSALGRRQAAERKGRKEARKARLNSKVPQLLPSSF